jgi:predicted Zn-dependent protease
MNSAVKTPVPPEFENLFKRALERRNGGHESEAVQILRQLRDIRPDSASVHAILGEILWGQRKLDEAITAFGRAVELSPMSELASLGLFHTLWESGQRQSAMKEMDRFLSLSKSVEYDDIARELVRKPVSKGKSDE